MINLFVTNVIPLVNFDINTLPSWQNITVQTLAGTGALDLGAAFLGKFFQGRKQVFISQPSWINHYLIFKNYSFDVKAYRYYDHMNRTFDMAGFFEDIEQIPDHSVILFQPCGHNPSAIELTVSNYLSLSLRVLLKSDLCRFSSRSSGQWCRRLFVTRIYCPFSISLTTDYVRATLERTPTQFVCLPSMVT